jgi:menaquinone-dependent protoporphyrinogen IX oxidase
MICLEYTHPGGNTTLKTMVIYESKYGCTRDAAKIIGLILGPSRRCRTSQFGEECRNFDFIVLGTPIYSGRIHPAMENFIRKEREWLRKKKIAIFCTCLHGQEGLRVLREVEDDLKGDIIELGVLGGKLKLERLKESDYQAFKDFTSRIGLPPLGMDLYRQDEVINWALHIKDLRDDILDTMPVIELKRAVQEFIISHNTCTLSSGKDDRVRATPVEYTYYQGQLYIFSEGGEKFANILLNENVSLAIYDAYTDMEHLAGIQITGIAELVADFGEYQKIIELKGLSMDFIQQLKVDLNLIRVQIEKLEFINSKFKDKGYQVRQILKF